MLQGFSTSIYGLCEVSSVELMKQSVRDTLLTVLSRAQLFDLLSWFYLSACGLATYQTETETLDLKFFRTIATERDAILNLTLLLFGMNSKDVLPRLESLFSQKMTEIFANQGVKDPRVPLEYDELDVAASLDSMTNPGEKIIDELYEH